MKAPAQSRMNRSYASRRMVPTPFLEGTIGLEDGGGILAMLQDTAGIAGAIQAGHLAARMEILLQNELDIPTRLNLFGASIA